MAKRRPGTTPQAVENEMTALAMDMAREQLENRTASSQVLTHFLKLATVRDELEKEKLKKENMLLEAKTEAVKSAKKTEELMTEALAAMKEYSGHE